MRARTTGLWCLLVAGCGMDADAPEPPARTTVVDSAGVEIVTSHAPAWGEDEAWSFDPSPVLSFGGATNEIGDDIWQVRDGARLSDGRIALLAGGRDRPRVLIFNRQGELDRAIGRSGQGPGEFMVPGRFQVLPGDTLVVWEAAFGRVTSFDSDGNVLGIRHLDLERIQEVARFAERASGVVRPLPDGSFVTTSPSIVLPDREFPIGERTRRPRAYTRVHPDYTADTLGIYGESERVGYERPDGGRSVVFPLLAAGSVVRVTDDPLLIYISRGDDRGINVFNEGGRLVRIVRRSIPPMPVTPEVLRTVLHGRLDGMNVPPELRAEEERFFRAHLPERTHFPVMSGLVTDRLGYLWVVDGQVMDGEGPAGRNWIWSNFDPEGRWLGRISLPLRSIIDIGEDYLLARRWDEMMVESVHEYRLDRRGGVGHPSR